MKNYMFLFHVNEPIEDNSEQSALWATWFSSLGEHLVDGGNPFSPSAEAKISEGIVTHDPDTVSGYSIISADSLEEATELAKNCPLALAPGCAVKIYETTSM